MSETGFWWSHWGHLLTKPLLAVPLWWLAGQWLPPVPAMGLALLLPAMVSLGRKAILWPGSVRRETWMVMQDEVADTVAAAVVVVPLGTSMLPMGMRVAFGVALVALLWPVGLHRWARP